jgi:threonylcarbamoyladenosine tRNA methylthiotransferase MtaB
MKYSVITFGCRVNQADSLTFEEDFIARGASAASPEESDVVVVNTCSVTASADQAARQAIRRVARINPDAKIIVTGCYATRRLDEVASLPNVLRVIPNDNKTDLVGTVSPPDQSTAERFGGGEGSCGALIQPGVAGRTAFTLRVQTGCAEPCSYCIIPTTRGKPVSVLPSAVLHEIDRVVASGFKEIALTGVHLGSYGRDLEPQSSLIDLLEAIAARSALQADVLFRISSLEPMDCTREIVDLVARMSAFAPHFHLPLQHASDRLLAAMRRPYTLEFYSGLVDRIRSLIPHASIGTDIIAGFPGETDEDFECLAKYLATSPLTHLHVFPYSDRPGTPAATLSPKVHGSIVRERANCLRAISQQLSSRFHQSQVGAIHRALTLDDGTLAVTGNYLKVRIPPVRIRNEWIDVRVISATPLQGLPLSRGDQLRRPPPEMRSSCSG